MINKTDLAVSPFSPKEASLLESVRKACILKKAAEDLSLNFKETQTLPGASQFEPATKKDVLTGKTAMVYSYLLDRAMATIDSINVRSKDSGDGVVVLRTYR